VLDLKRNKIKFEGCKKVLISKTLQKTKNKKKDKDFWIKLFDGYQIPSCPSCDRDLKIKRVTFEFKIPSVFYSQNPFFEDFCQGTLYFQCRHCKTEIIAVAQGLTFQKNKSGLGTFRVETLNISEIRTIKGEN